MFSPERRPPGSRTGRSVRLPIAFFFAAILGAIALQSHLEDTFLDPSFDTREALLAPADAPVAEGAIACVEELRLRRGQAPAVALQEAGFDPREVRTLLAALGTLVDVRGIRPSDCFRIFRHRNGELTRLDFQRRPDELVVVEPAGEIYLARHEQLPVERRLVRVAGTVAGSLYESLIDVGGTPSLVVEYSDLFAWSFDFLTDTRNGDRFDLLVEERWLNGERIESGRVLAGRYLPVGASRPMEATWFAPEGKVQEGGYFQANGESIRRQFLKSPLNFRRISSHFSHSRMHPIFKKSRPHLGVDYAAAQGTPVVALGNGRVTHAGWINGFGKTVKIKHNNTYLTQYAHLSGFAKGMRSGARVQQGQVIGYVGSTGHATGPHLDFRVQENGRWVNPLTVKGGRAEPLPGRLKPAFETEASRLAGLFEDLEPGSWLALDPPRPGEPLAAVQLDTPRGS